MPDYFLKKKSLLDRFKDNHGRTGYIQSARAEHTWSNPIKRNRRTKELNGWIKSFAGKKHIRKLARFNTLNNGKNENLEEAMNWINVTDNTQEILKNGSEKTSLNTIEDVVADLAYAQAASDTAFGRPTTAKSILWKAAENFKASELNFDDNGSFIEDFIVNYEDQFREIYPYAVQNCDWLKLDPDFDKTYNSDDKFPFVEWVISQVAEELFKYAPADADAKESKEDSKTYILSCKCGPEDTTYCKNKYGAWTDHIEDAWEGSSPDSFTDEMKQNFADSIGAEIADLEIISFEKFESKKNEVLVLPNPTIIYKGPIKDAKKAFHYVSKILADKGLGWGRVSWRGPKNGEFHYGHPEKDVYTVTLRGSNDLIKDSFAVYKDAFGNDFWNNCDADPQGWVDPQTIARYDVATPRQESKESAEYTVHSHNATNVVQSEDGTPETWRCKRCGGLEGGEDGDPFGYYITNSKGKTVISPLCSYCVDDVCETLNATHGNINKALGFSESKKPTYEKLGYEKGHKNSKGEDAPWVIRSHEDNRILASFAKKKDAEEHMQRMKQYSKSESKKSETKEDGERCVDDYDTLTDGLSELGFVPSSNIRNGMIYPYRSRFTATKDGVKYHFWIHEDPSGEYTDYIEVWGGKFTTNGDSEDPETTKFNTVSDVLNNLKSVKKSEAMAGKHESKDVSLKEIARTLDTAINKDGNYSVKDNTSGVTATDKDRTQTIKVSKDLKVELEDKNGKHSYEAQSLRELSKYIRRAVKGEYVNEDFHKTQVKDAVYDVINRHNLNNAVKVSYLGNSVVCKYADRTLRIQPDLLTTMSTKDGDNVDTYPTNLKELDGYLDRVFGHYADELAESKQSEGLKLDYMDTITVPQWLWDAYTYSQEYSIDEYGVDLNDDEMAIFYDFKEKYKDCHLDDRGEEPDFHSRNDFDCYGGNCYVVDVYTMTDVKEKKSEKLFNKQELESYARGADILDQLQYRFSFSFYSPKTYTDAADTALAMNAEGDKRIAHETIGDSEFRLYTDDPYDAIRFRDGLSNRAGIPAEDLASTFRSAVSIRKNGGYATEDEQDTIGRYAAENYVSFSVSEDNSTMYVEGELPNVVEFFETISSAEPS